jgi:glucose-1-phosphate thymidylyltransferase
MIGVILAGGTGSRLWPLTREINKHLLPIFDKPLIFHPLSTLMNAGIRDIIVVTNPEFKEVFASLLMPYEALGLKFQIRPQPSPDGVAGGLLSIKDLLEDQKSCVVLGDNVFHGSGVGRTLSYLQNVEGAHIFVHEVKDPSQYGVLYLDGGGSPAEIVEKPQNPHSNLAITGLYFFDETLAQKLDRLRPSHRGEFEIVDVLSQYLSTQDLAVTKLTRGSMWMDAGTPGSLHDSGQFVRLLEERQGQKVAVPEEIAWRQGWISTEELHSISRNYPSSKYREYLMSLSVEDLQVDI